MIEDLREEYERLSSDGFRVLAIAYKDMPRQDGLFARKTNRRWCCGATSRFSIRPRRPPRPAIEALRKHGVAVKVLTGDNDLVSRKICSEVGIPTEGTTLLGTQVEQMSDAELAEAAEQATLFARLSPAHKQRIIKALQSKGHVVGFMGDGINDAPAPAGRRRRASPSIRPSISPRNRPT